MKRKNFFIKIKYAYASYPCKKLVKFQGREIQIQSCAQWYLAITHLVFKSLIVNPTSGNI